MFKGCANVVIRAHVSFTARIGFSREKQDLQGLPAFLKAGLFLCTLRIVVNAFAGRTIQSIS